MRCEGLSTDSLSPAHHLGYQNDINIEFIRGISSGALFLLWLRDSWIGGTSWKERYLPATLVAELCCLSLVTDPGLVFVQGVLSYQLVVSTVRKKLFSKTGVVEVEDYCSHQTSTPHICIKEL
jgi:hypothetical protein